MKQPANLQHTTPLTVRSPQFKIRRSGLRILLGLLALAIVVNLGFMLIYGGSSNLPLTARSEQSSQLIAVQTIDDQRTVAATLTNQVQILTNGAVAQQTQFDAPIGGLAYVASEQTLYVGTSDGILRLLNQELQPTGEIAINRRIVGLQPATDGGVLVANGIGAFSDRYYISHIKQGQDKPLWTKRVEFTITDLRVLNGAAIYSTANARVGALDAAGEQRWVTPLPNTATRLLPLQATNRILVGDEKGSVTLLDDAGTVVWTSSVTPYPIRGLYYDEPTATFYAGDTQGSVFAVDGSGQKRLTLKAGNNDIEVFLPQSDGTAVVVPRNGVWQTLNPLALNGSTRAQTMGWVLAGIDSLLLIGLCIAMVLTVERWYIATPRVWQRFRQSQVSYLMVLPALILIILFTYYPAALALYYSFTNFSLRNITRFIGLQNYITIISSDFYFRVGIVNMLLILITSVIKSIAVPLLVAELVFWLRNDVHRYVFRTLFVLPAVVPGLVGTLLWRMVYDPTSGMLNQVLRAIGLGAWQRAWLGDENTALWAIIGAGFPWIGAFPFLIYMGGLLNINGEIYDAGRIDGTNWWTRFWSIDIPLLRSQNSLVLFFAFLGSIQGFAMIQIYTQGGPGYATYVPAFQMYKKIAEGDFGYASSIGMILFAIVMLGTALNARFRRRSEDI